MKKVIYFCEDATAVNIDRANPYFYNVELFKEFLADENKERLFINDDRMLAHISLNGDRDIELYFWAYNVNRYVSTKEFYPNIRPVNNIEAMWRRHTFWYKNCPYEIYNPELYDAL